MTDPTGARVETRDSPNQSAWSWGEDGIRRVVAHTPQGSYEGSIAHTVNPAAEVSYHRLLSEDGKHAVQLVPWSKKAWHVGDMNSRAEGISACCYADKLTPEVEAMLAKTIAWRLVERGLPATYNPSRDPLARGYCRHGDLQDDRSDPMTALRFRRVIVPKVRFWYRRYSGMQDRQSPEAKLRAREGFWSWLQWLLGEGDWQKHGRRNVRVRPNVPRKIPLRWWSRVGEFVANRGEGA